MKNASKMHFFSKRRIKIFISVIYIAIRFYPIMRHIVLYSMKFQHKILYLGYYTSILVCSMSFGRVYVTGTVGNCKCELKRIFKIKRKEIIKINKYVIFNVSSRGRFYFLYYVSVALLRLYLLVLV